jgi:hypothetical protein
MEEFFVYLDHELRLKRGIPISVDLFGYTVWEPIWGQDYDLNIGQRLDKAAFNFDFVSPMVYPSHYTPGFLDMANPALYPYEVVHENILSGEKLLASLREKSPDLKVCSLRPWIQDFDLGADYGPEEVRAQMKASVDGGASGWLIWNAGNRYTEAALEPKGQVE